MTFEERWLLNRGQCTVKTNSWDHKKLDFNGKWLLNEVDRCHKFVLDDLRKSQSVIGAGFTNDLDP